MTTWYTADLHFNHTNIIKYCNRPFADLDDMNEKMIEYWNELVQPEDTVYVLGDFSLSLSALQFVSLLNGTKKLIAGNHDQCWIGNKKHASATKRYLEAGFESVNSNGYQQHKLGNLNVMISHLPYAGDSHDNDRYSSYRPKNEGAILICGHVHDSWSYTETPRQINVGVDVSDFRPISEEMLLAEIYENFGVIG